MPRVAFRNFTGGEVIPTLSARYDLQKFGTLLQSCENFLPNLHGDIERRPGTHFVGALGGASVLIPFQFNTDPENNYVLIFQAGSIRVASANGILPDVSLPSPYALEDVYQLSVAQVGDVVYLAHKNYAFRKLTRSGVAPDYEWALEEVALNQSIAPPDAPTVTWHGDGGDFPLSYVVTAVDEDGVESIGSPVGSANGQYPTDWVQGDYVSLSWQAVDGATEYNIYRESAGYYGFIGVVSAGNATGGTVSGLQVGDTQGSLVHFSGLITRTVVIGNGKEDVQDSDVSTDLVVSADEGTNAFVADGKLFVLVTRETTVTEWAPVYEEEVVSWESTTMTSTEQFWVMVTPADTGSPAGTYTEWQQGTTDDNTDAPRGTFGPYTVRPVYVGATTITFQDQNYEPDTATTPKEDWNPFENGNNPSTVCFHQQRMCLAGTKDNPASFYMSRTGDYESFRKSRPLQDDDPVEYMLASGSIDDVKWMASFGDLLIGTAGGEYQATSSGAAITSSDVQISVQTYWGSSNLAPIIIGQSILHCQRSGHHVRDLYYSWESDGYNGNDLSILAPQLVEDHTLLQWAYQQAPGSNVWMVRDDGTLLCLTYMKEQNVFGWSRHTTQGKVLSLTVINGDEGDVAMMVVEREIGGQKRYFLERLADRFRDANTIEDAFYVDCGLTIRNETATDTVSGLSHLEGCEVVALADGSPVEGLVVEGGKVTLPYAAKTVSVGLGYTSALCPIPLESDTQQGSTLGKRRAYGKCVLRLYRSVGGKYAATRPGDLWLPNAWKERESYDIPFLPDAYGEACQPFSGDVEITLPSGQDADTSIWLMQDRPMPFRVAAIAMDVDFGEM